MKYKWDCVGKMQIFKFCTI